MTRAVVVLLAVVTGCSFNAADEPPRPAPLVPLVRLFTERSELGSGATYGQAADGRVFLIGGSTPVDALFGATSMGISGFNICGIFGSAPCDFECATLANSSLVCKGATSAIPGSVVGETCSNPNYCVRDSMGGCSPAWGGQPTYNCAKDWSLVPDAPKLREIQDTCGVDDSEQIQCWSGKMWRPPPLVLQKWPEVGEPQRPFRSGNGVRALRTQFAVLVDGTLLDLKTGLPVRGLSDVKDACGTTLETACAITGNGRVLCWGDDLEGFAIAVRNPTLSGSGYVALDCGLGTRCAVRSDATVDCWGYGMGDEACGYQGADRCASNPQAILGLDGVKQIVVEGLGYFLALRTDGSVVRFDSSSAKHLNVVHATK